MDDITGRKIFAVEDDAEMLDKIEEYFSAHNEVIRAESFCEARKLLKSTSPDIVLLDLLLPDGNGLDLIPCISEKVPVIILSDLGSDEAIIGGLRAGACDYMVKPYSLDVLKQRMILRLLPLPLAKLDSYGMELDTRMRTVSYKGKDLKLTTSEFDILYFLMKNAGEFFTSAEIYENIRLMAALNTGTIRYHIHNLREKMSAISPDCAALLLTKFGCGYAFLGGGGGSIWHRN